MNKWQRNCHQRNSIQDCPLSAKAVKASAYFCSFKKYYKKHPEMKVIIYCRVSSSTQKHKKNLDTQEIVIRKRLKKKNIQVVGCYREVYSGWVNPKHRKKLIEAVNKAKENDAIIMAVSSERFLRSKKYNSISNFDVLPSVDDYQRLINITGNIRLLTLLHPNKSPNKVRGLQSKWGQLVKENKGGRPRTKNPGYKKQLREQKLPRVQRLHDKGRSIRTISKKVGVSKSTVHRWLASYIQSQLV